MAEALMENSKLKKHLELINQSFNYGIIQTEKNILGKSTTFSRLVAEFSHQALFDWLSAHDLNLNSKNDFIATIEKYLDQG